MIINDESAIFEILETYELNSDEPQLKENILSLVRPTGNQSCFKINNLTCTYALAMAFIGFQYSTINID